MNFVIYEVDEQFLEVYKNIIFKLMSNFKMAYKTILLRECLDTEEINVINESKIYIIDASFKGLDFVRKIRESGDYSSQIILMLDSTKFKIVHDISNLLILDFISKTEDITSNLCNALKVALKINKINALALCFSFDGELFQIPYQDILYIEKNLNNNSSLVITKNNEYVIRKSIVMLEKELCNQDMFFKTHRSCIVNMNNITHVNFNKGIITFIEHETSLLARARKSEFKSRLALFMI